MFPLRKVADGFFVEVEHGPDEGQTGAVQIGHRQKTADAPLIDQRKGEGLHGVIVMMPQGHLVGAQFHGGLIQDAPAQFGTQRTGVFLFSDVENDLTDLGPAEGIGYLQPGTQIGDRGEVHLFVTHVQRHRQQFKRYRRMVPQLGQQPQQGQRILPARNAHGNPVSGREHLIIPNALSHLGQQLLHNINS